MASTVSLLKNRIRDRRIEIVYLLYLSEQSRYASYFDKYVNIPAIRIFFSQYGFLISQKNIYTYKVSCQISKGGSR